MGVYFRLVQLMSQTNSFPHSFQGQQQQQPLQQVRVFIGVFLKGMTEMGTVQWLRKSQLGLTQKNHNFLCVWNY